jgi:hypothetical protein
MQGHMEFECPEILKDGRRQEGRIHIVEVELVVVVSEVVELRGRVGKNLMMRKILLQPKKEVEKELK